MTAQETEYEWKITYEAIASMAAPGYTSREISVFFVKQVAVYVNRFRFPLLRFRHFLAQNILQSSFCAVGNNKSDFDTYTKKGRTVSSSAFDEFIGVGQTRQFIVPGGTTAANFIQESATGKLVVVEK